LYSSVGSQAKIISWGVRSLYVLLFLFLMSIMGRWHLPFTLAYLGAIVCLVITGLSVVQNNEVWEELNDMYLEDLSGFATTEAGGVLVCHHSDE